MQNWPDPDSPEMGHLVDRWLVFLRQEGMSGRQLERMARALARVSEQGWKANTEAKHVSITSFTAWLHASGCQSSKNYTQKWNQHLNETVWRHALT